jgi:hypothetical protein
MGQRTGYIVCDICGIHGICEEMRKGGREEMKDEHEEGKVVGRLGMCVYWYMYNLYGS